MLVILDNGHGYDTLGKCSPKLPDGRKFYEWKFNRKVEFTKKKSFRLQFT